MKSPLLFFDGIALSLPKSRFKQVVESDPVLALPLLERGRLQNLEPENTLSSETYEYLAAALYDLAVLYEEVPFDRSLTLCTPHFLKPELPAGGRLFELLLRRGLASDYSPRSRELLITPGLRAVMLYFYGQALHYTTATNGGSFKVEPINWDRQFDTDTIAGLRAFSARISGRNGNLYCLAPEIVIPIDLSSIPLDELLDFRAENAADLRSYLIALRRHTEELLTATDSRDRMRIQAERQAEIDDYNANLRAKSRRNTKRSVTSLSVSILGVGWTAATGDLGSAIFALMAAIASRPRNDSMHEVTSFSYLAKISRKFENRG